MGIRAAAQQTITARVANDPVDVETAWIDRARSDPAAFAPLYQRYSAPIYRYCYRHVRNTDDANDLTTHVFIRAIEHLHRYQTRPGGTFRSWLYTIARNAITDHWRRQRPTSDIVGIDQRLTDPALLPEELAAHRDELARLIAVLHRLAPNQRAIIELRIEGLTTIEIADALALTVAAVKSAQSRAYKHLRDLLQAPEGPSR